MQQTSSGHVLGINGLGRIGKLTLWHHLGRKYFSELVVNIGRAAGQSLADVAHYIERDSTYGRLHHYLYGHQAQPLIETIDQDAGTMMIDGVLVRFLQTARNPKQIAWNRWNAGLVVDTTGQFLDPSMPADQPSGALRGHLEAGAQKVIVSAPFKLKKKTDDLGGSFPPDAVTTVMGINDHDFDPRCHTLISNASCTTTCLAHMIKPLIQYFGANKILSASMATVHAATGSQQVLDRLPKTGASDLRKNRSIANNIILTSTGAARALRLVIPEMAQIGFIAESVRVPVSSGSLIILVVNFQEGISGEFIRRADINQVYQQAATEDPNQYLHYTNAQTVSGDIVGVPKAAAIIEGHETHTRTAEIPIDLSQVPGIPAAALTQNGNTILRLPVTQAVIYGWYDNEMGSYVNMLGDRTVSIAEEMH